MGDGVGCYLCLEHEESIDHWLIHCEKTRVLWEALFGVSWVLSSSARNIITFNDEINKYAFSGGQDSIENHRKYGANLEVDIPIKYLGFFLEDDAELEYIRTEYGAGRMLTGDVKKRLIEVLTEVVERHRRARAAVTDEGSSSLEKIPLDLL
ncbi:Tryptophan--tRNA ligase, cytoplasmic [Vitis vinifera]|uniref:tryptophan--tRNA ligase n=1 Tax=Vitis vinifera TaxID=29760 RepID=A0A438EGN9_VITVI|nr:Tryptophan--tRNA ligase, cytoplasmic [Vitis vinifera]